MVLDLQKRTYFLVTGASRGIGQTMAIRMAGKLMAGSVIVLLARGREGLAKTKSAIDDLDLNIEVRTFTVDLSKATAPQLATVLAQSVPSGVEASQYERAIVIHNAGTTGDVSKRAIDIGDTATWTSYYHLNLFSMIALNSEFFRLFAKVPKVVVNISSKCATDPFFSMAYYCTSKAARDMFFKVLAVEEKHDTIVLNYAPGAIDTDMTVTVQRETINSDLAAAFKQQRDTNTLLTTEQTTEKFIRVLEEQKFSSGDHVDYWD